MKLTMAAAIGLGVYVPLMVNATPSITTQPEPQMVPVGYPAYFAVEASGVAPLSYSWYKNGVAITGANTNFYFTPPVTPGDSGALYTVVVTDSTSTNSGSNGVLSVLAAVPSTFNLPPFYFCSTNYYVATNGNDAYTAAQAQSNSTPWRTITNALTVLKNQGGTHGGVCVNVGDGDYPEVVNNSGNGFSISGSSDTTNGYFVLRSQNPHGARIVVPADAPNNNSHAIWFADARYVVIDGFVLAGDHSQGNTGGEGIRLTGANPPAACDSHHYRLYNNRIYGFGGCAIHATHVDYVEQRNNVCFSCAATYNAGPSGIDYWHPIALDSGVWNTVASNNASFHIIIGDNISFNNFECNIGTPHGDGNGIICDDFNGTQTTNYDLGIMPYTNRTLVEGNLAFNNGAAGVAVGGGCGSYVTIRNNTCCNNSGDDNITSSWRGEIKIAANPNTTDGVQSSDNNIVINNIVRAKVGTGHTVNNTAFADVSSGAENTNNLYLNNLTYNGTSGQASLKLVETTATITSANGNLLGTNPQFTSETNFDFTLQSSSRAIDAATSVSGLPLVDLNGVIRPRGAAVDLGAYEYGYSLLINYIEQLGGDMLITFSMGPGATNTLQASGGIGGTNVFTNIFVVPSNTYAGAVTNFLDAGAVSNFPSRFYRVRLGP